MQLHSTILRQRRADRARARQRRADMRHDIATMILGTVFALVIAAPWIMLALQIPTVGNW